MNSSVNQKKSADLSYLSLKQTLPLLIKSEKNSELIASPWSNKLYSSTQSRHGRVWIWIYNIIHLFDKNDQYKHKKLNQTILNVYEQWSKLLTIANTELAIREHGDKGSVDSLMLLCQLIDPNSSNNTETIKESITKINRVFSQTIQKSSPIQVDDFCRFYNRLQKEVEIMELESKLENPIKIDVLNQLGKTSLDKIEDSSTLVNAIAKSYKNKKNSLSVRTLHHGLKQIVKKNGGGYSELFKLEYQLHKSLERLECPIFLQKDPLHEKWVLKKANCRHPEKVNDHGNILSLGLPFKSIKRQANDQNLVFHVEGNDSIVVRYSLRNETSLALEQLERKKSNWGLPLADRQLAENGLFTVEEKLGKSPMLCSWDKAAPNYKIYEKGLIQFLNELVNSEYLPADLDPSKVFFDKKGHLKFTSIPAKTKNDLLPIHKFIEQLSVTDEKFYTKLIFRSKLGLQPLAQLQRKAIAAALRENDSVNECHEQMKLLGITKELEIKMNDVERQAVCLRNDYCAIIRGKYILSEWHS
ncbi:MAG: hypothetical protein JHC93_01385, partial [Parachlamydiales bacterium]|nr:hypothetical protein [Parachlamydiales bacterium]